ncbi:histidine phosphotransferase [Thelephora terrestris]|uniref:Histidine phosphotransferase n=1 Tax=Thelephora terrestris TaxID=56493 RepID=A0A9P6HNI6_9AGAM|nr:histidine phosphotransferase [Thelephora terrestris]
MEIFQQILELDDDDETHEFSFGMVEAYFDQAVKTFEEMEKAIVKKDCDTLSSKGHFLKGSSATLGITKVREACESIQNYGSLWDDKTGKALTADVALPKIEAVLEEAKISYGEAELWLKNWYLDARG